MKNEINVITSHLQQIMNGYPTPPFMGEDFKALLSAIAAITVLDGNDVEQQAAFESIGRKTATLVLDRLQAGMVTERAVSVMRNIAPNQT